MCVIPLNFVFFLGNKTNNIWRWHVLDRLAPANASSNSKAIELAAFMRLKKLTDASINQAVEPTPSRWRNMLAAVKALLIKEMFAPATP